MHVPPLSRLSKDVFLVAGGGGLIILSGCLLLRKCFSPSIQLRGADVKERTLTPLGHK